MAYPSARAPENVDDQRNSGSASDDYMAFPKTGSASSDPMASICITRDCVNFIVEKLPESRNLQALIAESLKTVAAKKVNNELRSALSHHTTRACQPKKHSGAPVVSLASCGLNVDNCVQLPSGSFSVCVDLPNSYEAGDNLQLSASGEGRNQIEALRQATMKILTTLLAIAPAKVHLPPGAFARGQDAIDDIRAAASLVQTDLYWYIFRHSSDVSDDLRSLAPLRNLFAHARQRPEATNAGPKRQTASAPSANETEEERRRRIDTVVRMLMKYCHTSAEGEFWPDSPTPLQKDFLMTFVHPGTLKQIVQDHDGIFKLEWCGDNSKRWYIKLQEPKQGHPASASSGPEELNQIHHPACASSSNFRGNWLPPLENESPACSGRQQISSIPVVHKRTNKILSGSAVGQTASPESLSVVPPPPTRPCPRRSQSAVGPGGATPQLPPPPPPPPDSTETAVSYYCWQ